MANNCHRNKAYFAPSTIPFFQEALRNKTRVVPDKIHGRILPSNSVRTLIYNDFLRPEIQGKQWYDWKGRLYITASGANAFTQFMKDKSEDHPRTRKYY